MKHQKIRDLILKNEREIVQASSKDPLMIKGREFLRRTPSHKIDSFLEKSDDVTLSSLIGFFNFLLKREDISSLEEIQIRSFIKVGKIELETRKRKELFKATQEQAIQLEEAKLTIKNQTREIEIQKEKIETQRSAVRELHDMLRKKSHLINEQMSIHRGVIQANRPIHQEF